MAIDAATCDAMESRKPNRKAVAVGVPIVVLLVAVSLLQGMLNSTVGSQDFQWSPTVLFIEGTNPYAHHLNGNHDGRLVLSQYPNYGHLLYFLLFPFGLLDWPAAKLAWAAFNLAAFAAVVWIFLREQTSRAQRHAILLVAALLCIGYPLRNAIGNGQQTVLCMLAATLAWHLRSKPVACGAALAILVTKYTFGVPVVLAFAIAGAWAAVGIAVAISFIAALLFAVHVDSSLASVLFAPLQVARSTSIGMSDLLSLARLLGPDDPYASQPALAIALLLMGAWSWHAWRLSRGSHLPGDARTRVILASSIHLSLGVLPHLGYDAAMLLVSFLLLMPMRDALGKAAPYLFGANVLCFWFLSRLVAPLFPSVLANPALVAGLTALNVLSAFVVLQVLSADAAKRAPVLNSLSARRPSA